jgi:hypothetical protein
VAAIAGLCGTAWACVPQPFISLRPDASGSSGEQVSAAGINFGDDTVDLRWNGIDGPLLAKAQGPSFSTSVTVPGASDGLYTILAIPRAPDGAVHGSVAAAVFQVVSTGRARGGTGTATGQRNTRSTTSPSGSLNAVAAAIGGAGLLVLGICAGLALSRRRRRAAA